MKIIREYINEKFDEDSDPISDMGIGGVKLETLISKKEEELERRKKELEAKTENEINKLIKDLLMGRTITGTMMKLPAYTKSGKQISKVERGKFTVKIKDIVDYEIGPFSVNIVIYSEDKKAYSIMIKDKIFIR